MLDIARRAALHGALADESRLTIVDELATSDRSPTELSELVGQPANLLAHHLDVLESVGLIERFTSSGDRRRRYVRLIGEPLADVGIGMAASVGRVVFVCHHNSARSQLAAALWERHTGAAARSAGTDPADAVHPGAIAAAERAGLDLTGAHPKHLDHVEAGEHVITVCDRAHEALSTSSGWWHWSITAPTDRGGDRSAFDEVVADLDHRIQSVTRTVRATP